MNRQFVNWMILVVMALIAISARLTLIHLYSMDLPYLDQWDQEARSLYIPFEEGTLGPSSLFQLFQQHRIFFTRITALGLYVANGQWDNRLQMVTSSLIYVAIIVAIARSLSLLLRNRHLTVIAFSCLLIVACPYACENTLHGFQSQMYYVIAFSFGTLFLLLNNPPFSWRWNIDKKSLFRGTDTRPPACACPHADRLEPV